MIVLDPDVCLIYVSPLDIRGVDTDVEAVMVGAVTLPVNRPVPLTSNVYAGTDELPAPIFVLPFE